MGEQTDEEDYSGSEMMNGGPDLTLRKTLHTEYSTDDDQLSAAERRKSFTKNMKSGKGGSLDESSAGEISRGMKSSASEILNGSTDSFLGSVSQTRKDKDQGK